MDVYGLMKSRVDQRIQMHRKNQESNARLQMLKDVYLQKMIKTGDDFRKIGNNLNYVNNNLHDNSGHSLEAIPCNANDHHLHDCEHYKRGIGVNEKRFQKWRFEEMANRRHIDMQSCGKFVVHDRSGSEDLKKGRQLDYQRCKSAPAGKRRTPDPFKSLRRTPVWNPDSRSESIQAWADLQHQSYVEKVLSISSFKKKRASAEPKAKPITGSDSNDRLNRAKSAPQPRVRIRDDRCRDSLAIGRVQTANRELETESPHKERSARKTPESERNNSSLLKTIMDMTTSPKPIRRQKSKSPQSESTKSLKSPDKPPPFAILSKRDFEIQKPKRKVKKVKDSDDESVDETKYGPYVPRWRRELLIEAPPHVHELVQTQAPCTMPKWERRRLLSVMMKDNREKLRQTKISDPESQSEKTND